MWVVKLFLKYYVAIRLFYLICSESGVCNEASRSNSILNILNWCFSIMTYEHKAIIIHTVPYALIKVLPLVHKKYTARMKHTVRMKYTA